MVYYHFGTTLKPSRFLLNPEFTAPPPSHYPEHRSQQYRRKFNVSAETTDMEPDARFRRVMARTYVGQFMEPDQEAQSEMDLDLLPVWLEREDRRDDQLIRQEIKADGGSLSFEAAKRAAAYVIPKIRAFVVSIEDSVYNEHSSNFSRPLCEMSHYDSDRSGYGVADPVIFYPRLLCFPKYTGITDWYDPQAKFWRRYRRKASKYPSPTESNPVPITTCLQIKPVPADLPKGSKDPNVVDFERRWLEREELCNTVDQEFKTFEHRRFERIRQGYPPASKLQAEQQLHVQCLLFAFALLQVAVVRDDIPCQMFLYSVISDIFTSLTKLTLIAYSIRFKRCR